MLKINNMVLLVLILSLLLGCTGGIKGLQAKFWEGSTYKDLTNSPMWGKPNEEISTKDGGKIITYYKKEESHRVRKYYDIMTGMTTYEIFYKKAKYQFIVDNNGRITKAMFVGAKPF